MVHSCWWWLRHLKLDSWTWNGAAFFATTIDHANQWSVNNSSSLSRIINGLTSCPYVTTISDFHHLCFLLIFDSRLSLDHKRHSMNIYSPLNSLRTCFFCIPVLLYRWWMMVILFCCQPSWWYVDGDHWLLDQEKYHDVTACNLWSQLKSQ